MSEWLLLFTIGPVQPFIGNSRKMRDLYAGSFLLSHLMRQVCHEILSHKTDVQIEKIIPIDTPNVPNRILLKVIFPEGESKKNGKSVHNRMKQLAQTMEQSIRQEFRKVCEAVFKQCSITPQANVWNQLSHFPEVYWACLEHSTSLSDFEKITAKLQSVKSLRAFSQSTERAGRKCSLFPQYNALFYRAKDQKKPKYIDDPDAVEFTGEGTRFYALKPGEGLCALAFIKRMLYCIKDDVLPGYNRNILSVASMLLENCLENDAAGQALLAKLPLEAAEAFFDCQNGFKPSEDEYKASDIQAAEQLYSYMHENNLSVSPYYAVMKFDGDDMGKIYQEYSIEKQQQLSKEIGDFAETVPDIIKSLGGMCIYAGGEDFLGFFPAAKALPALLALRSKFQDTVKHPSGSAKRLTFSAGIVFSHLMPPLKDVLVLVDEMENLAKSNPGKDSFAIAASKRSGKRTEIQNRFGENGINLKILSEISNLLGKELLSKSSVYTLVSDLSELSARDTKSADDMVKTLITQSICQFRGSNKIEEQNVGKLIDLYHQYNGDISSFVAALEIAVFLGKEDMSCITE